MKLNSKQLRQMIMEELSPLTEVPSWPDAGAAEHDEPALSPHFRRKANARWNEVVTKAAEVYSVSGPRQAGTNPNIPQESAQANFEGLINSLQTMVDEMHGSYPQDWWEVTDRIRQS
jgi:hypothetical protein